jgi:Asp-tRNA(Asn)/Glu-tRNA(Gln) amidotransferase B subunit
MKKNITLKIDEKLLKLCRYEAVESDKSLSQWVADLLAEHVQNVEAYQKVKERAGHRLREGFHLGGEPLHRDRLHER